MNHFDNRKTRIVLNHVLKIHAGNRVPTLFSRSTTIMHADYSSKRNLLGNDRPTGLDAFPRMITIDKGSLTGRAFDPPSHCCSHVSYERASPLQNFANAVGISTGRDCFLALRSQANDRGSIEGRPAQCPGDSLRGNSPNRHPLHSREFSSEIIWLVARPRFAQMQEVYHARTQEKNLLQEAIHKVHFGIDRVMRQTLEQATTTVLMNHHRLHGRRRYLNVAEAQKSSLAYGKDNAASGVLGKHATSPR
jgi:hypothetical protein